MKHRYKKDSLKDHFVKKYIKQYGIKKDDAEDLFEKQIGSCPEFVKEATRKSKVIPCWSGQKK